MRVSEKDVQRLHTKRCYTYQQLNQLREFKCELLEYYIMYAIWSWRCLDFCLPQGDIGFAHSDKKIGGIPIPQNETSLGTCSFSLLRCLEECTQTLAKQPFFDTMRTDTYLRRRFATLIREIKQRRRRRQ